MGNIVGEELQGYVIDQINARQTLHGSGVRFGFNERTPTQLNLLNSNTSWLKLASGISVSEERLKEIGLDAYVSDFKGKGLAKNYILYSGISRVEDQLVEDKYNVTKFVQREGFLPQNANSSYTYGDHGYSPMPGIVSADIKTLNRGSIKKATVKLTVNNRNQFNIIDLLYLRLGYTVLLEWGNAMYTNDGTDKEILRDTLIESMFFEKDSNGSYLDMLDPIEAKREKHQGNYDALLGKISNFSWSFNVDGSYDIELTIISLGDVIESLKTNIAVSAKTSAFLAATIGTPPKEEDPEQPSEPDPIAENKDSNVISSMLYIWKYLNSSPDSKSWKPINIVTQDGTDYNWIGGFLGNQQDGQAEEISATTVNYEFTIKWKKSETEYVEVGNEIKLDSQGGYSYTMANK